ncbi:ArnT family glycosyltransferase [Saccharicrinis sp. 156]|uniref:ArnT family glycosyltransferase n=1 Tax=Saccharicrinis sp. 156 TaxID=3417574 RepID=UPI003D342A1B
MFTAFTNNRKAIYYILIVNFIFRFIVAAFTNFGIDEVYYVSYGLYPDWSFFDHPPMISLLMRLTTLDMRLMDEVFIRLGSLMIGSANIFLLYKMGCILKDRQTGIIAALLASASIYASIIVGTFILPDTPQSLFWVGALYLFVRYIQTEHDKYIYLYGVTVGFAMLSKYHGVFLWGGAGLYFLVYNYRKVFSRAFVLSLLISLVIFTPVILWNYFNDLSSFNFHSERVGSGSFWPNFKNFFPEFFGQIFYNNPFNVVLIVVSLVYFFKNREWAISKPIAFLILTGVPLSALVLGMSMYSGTLPHWSGPGYNGLLVVAAIYYTSHLMKKSHKAAVRYVVGGNTFILFIITIALFQIHLGIIPLSKDDNATKLGKNDPTIDLYAWDSVGEQLNAHLNSAVDSGLVQKDYVLLTHKWFPAGHLDYYFALPNNKQLFVLGDIKSQHIYKRTNTIRGGVSLGGDACYITTSLYYREPKPELAPYFENAIETPDIIPIKRGKKVVMNVFIWYFNNLQNELPM